MTSGSRVLITGGSEGLGLRLAEQLARRGFRVTLVGRRKERLESVIRSLAGSGHAFFVADLTDLRQVELLCEMISAESYDVLVNNAGGTQFGRFDELSYGQLCGINQLNFATPMLLMRAFMRSAPPGSTLVNVTSIVGTIGVPGNAAYAAAKAGLQALTECVWYEGVLRKINVLDFRPVSLKTGFHQAAGKASMAVSWFSVSPEQAAIDLADAIEAHRGFVYPYGLMGWVLMAMHRILPKRWLLKMMARNAERAGYL